MISTGGPPSDAARNLALLAKSPVTWAWVALILFMRQLRENDRRQSEEHQRLATQVALRTTALRNLAGHHVHAREDERSRLYPKQFRTTKCNEKAEEGNRYMHRRHC